MFKTQTPFYTLAYNYYRKIPREFIHHPQLGIYLNLYNKFLETKNLDISIQLKVAQLLSEFIVKHELYVYNHEVLDNTYTQRILDINRPMSMLYNQELRKDLEDKKHPTLSLKQRCIATILGLAIGDSLGSISEFKIPWNVPEVMTNHPLWPLEIHGDDKWDKGEPTDDTDMTLAIIESYNEMAMINYINISRKFCQWASIPPKDIGISTNKILYRLGKKDDHGLLQYVKDPFLIGINYHKENPNNQSNGSLMRNAAVAVCLKDQPEHEVIKTTICQSMITHCHPTVVLCCVIHSILIHRALNQRYIHKLRAPDHKDLSNILNQDLMNFINNTEDINCLRWIKEISVVSIQQSIEELLDNLEGFKKFNPYMYYYKNTSGWVVLSLKISLWALYWSFKPKSKVPKCYPFWLPLKMFNTLNKFNVITWIAAIGADSDTYGAIAGSLLGAYHPYSIPTSMINDLLAKDNILKLI